ncbi:hypothetical protein LCGC14_1234370 [marine sediment metagenome]|uniref:4Fe-4S ferredoxin-type domain-containing protein n=1 Tax=marine sediment metagenome TaxID=412755 RepID=A0A0F9LBT0_9ZZZZ|nr:MAG: Ferredoxin domain containing protein [Candidatus Lokiarchaeum sp. GC14_75]HEA70898.1 4Fe-4S dicluster domain-containing protein [archaeon]
MQVYRLKINRNICTGCNICVVSCPINFDQLKTKSFLSEENAVILVKNGIAYDVFKEERKINCDGCGVCIKNCPQSAIHLELINVV